MVVMVVTRCCGEGVGINVGDEDDGSIRQNGWDIEVDIACGSVGVGGRKDDLLLVWCWRSMVEEQTGGSGWKCGL